MPLKHRVNISVSKSDGAKTKVIEGGSMNIRSRILSFLLGERMKILVISPGDSVSSVSIQELPEEGDCCERTQPEFKNNAAG